MSSRQAIPRWTWIVVAVLVILGAAWLSRDSIRSWLAPESTTPESVGPAGEVVEDSGPPLPELRSPPDAPLLERLRKVMVRVDELNRALVRDDLASAGGAAAFAGEVLETAAEETPPGGVTQTLLLARDAAVDVAEAESLDEARRQLGELNRVLFHLASHAEELREDYHVFRCPMAPGFPLWFQESESIANPYMGTSMPTCGVRTDWPLEDAGAAPSEADDASGEIAYWTCSMHPSVKQEGPETCPICSMNLTPVTVQERDEGLLFVDEHRRQLINLRTTTIEREPLVVSIRGYAEVVVADPLRHAVNLRVEGWIEELFADEPGQPIEAGAPLFRLFSPELYSAQDELLASRSGRSDELLQRARERLRLFSITEEQIEAMVERGSAEPTIEILAPRSGFLMRTSVIEGDRVPAGATVMEIAALDSIWIDLEVFEGDLPLLNEGMKVSLELSNVPDRRFSAHVDYVYPALDANRRAVRSRLVVENRDLALRPGLHARADIEVDLGERLLVPREAVVYTGPRRIVFLDIGEGRLLPREIVTGAATPTQLEVLSGLEAGDRVVSSGTFLIASESRIRSAETVWGASDED